VSWGVRKNDLRGIATDQVSNDHPFTAGFKIDDIWI
jgi:hypothetical protein